MHKVLKLAVVVFIGGVTGAGAAYQPVKSGELTDHPSMQSIAPRAAAAPSNSGLRMAQSDCGCNMLYQQGASQCQGFQAYNYQQYQYCMAAVQQNVGQCRQACASGGYGGGGYGGGGYGGGGYGGGGMTLCQQFPNNPACNR
jgi:hypothetical protein